MKRLLDCVLDPGYPLIPLIYYEGSNPQRDYYDAHARWHAYQVIRFARRRWQARIKVLLCLGLFVLCVGVPRLHWLFGDEAGMMRPWYMWIEDLWE